MTVLLASLLFGSLLSPALLLALALGWLCGAHALLALPWVAWLIGTAWLSANAGVRHHRGGQSLLDALTDAPLDVVEQLRRLVGRPRRRHLRLV